MLVWTLLRTSIVVLLIQTLTSTLDTLKLNITKSLLAVTVTVAERHRYCDSEDPLTVQYNDIGMAPHAQNATAAWNLPIPSTRILG